MIKNYEITNGDCIHVMESMIESKKQYDFSIFSPPFPQVYAYSQEDGDLGNSTSFDEFRLHNKFFCTRLFPLIKSGRNVAVHVQQIQRRKGMDGDSGIYDFRGAFIQDMVDAGFLYYGEVSIRKNPQAQSIQRNVHQLQFKNFHKDSTISRPALLDYIIIFKKPGHNEVPVVPSNNFPNISKREINNIWIDWAEGIWTTKDSNSTYLPYPIWLDIKETDTLNTKAAKDGKDERHICPLQLDLIERCIKLWTNKGETVFTPFGGIGSELYVSILHGRKAVGIELKESYYKNAIENCNNANQIVKRNESQLLLF